jgi:high frequency lysogenization protein
MSEETDQKTTPTANQHSLEERTLALAGVCQAASLAEQLANSGAVSDFKAFDTSLQSLYEMNPADTLAVYGGSTQGLQLGLRTLPEAFGRNEDYLNVLKYSLTLLALQRKLMKRPDYLETIQKGITDSLILRNGDEDFPPAVISKLANTYTQTISLLQPRIVVSGKPFYLKQPAITEKIRAILLAGIRSAVLWSQLGGSQWQLLFKRKALMDAAQRLRNTG